MFHRICIFIFILTTYPVILVSQSIDSLKNKFLHYHSLSITSPTDTSFILPHQFLIIGTERLMIDSLHLDEKQDYKIDARKGRITIHRSLIDSLISSSAEHTLHIWYNSFPLSFQQRYQRRETIVEVDTTTKEAIKVAKPVNTFSFDDVFSSNIQKNGSIVRGFSVGTNRDLSLRSGFRIQMSGDISDDINIQAVLTDENSPIQPEGTTQTLQEIDKVYIEISGKQFNTTLGDFNFNLEGDEFGNINRKLAGVKGAVNYDFGLMNGNVLAVGAVTRGKYISNQLDGFDGIQGPYRLMGENNNRAIIVVAGTERVFVNGEKMIRGENGDYIIDYSIAEVTFTNKRLISQGSRITIDFEYNDRQFNRSFYGIKNSIYLSNDRWNFNASFMKESDDENSPVDITLSDEDKNILRDAGGDFLRAVKSGVVNVGRGKGEYKDSTVIISGLKDTMITIYQFAPEDTINAVYSIFFTNIGIGKGSYKKISSGNYLFVGIGQGSYSPIRFLPMPRSHSLVNFGIVGNPTTEIRLNSEYTSSNYAPNKLSSLKSTEHQGGAMKFGILYKPARIKIGDVNIGTLDADFKGRFIEKNFVSMDRINDVEFSRKWNIEDSTKGDEVLGEGELKYSPISPLSVGGGLGWIRRSESSSSNRFNLLAEIRTAESSLIYYVWEKIKTKNNMLNAEWIRNKGDARYKIGILMPSLKYSYEYLTNKRDESDSLENGSYRLQEITPGISLSRYNDISADVFIGWRYDDSLSNRYLQHASKTFLQNYTVQYSRSELVSSQIGLTIHNRKYTKSFKDKSNIDSETILLRWQTELNPLKKSIKLDWFYEIATGRTTKLERIFQRVAKGTGNYRYVGDLNGNRIVDPPDFQLTRFDGEYIALTFPTDDLIPIIDLKASSRIRLNPKFLLSSSGWLEKVISTLSSETYSRIEEKSSELDRKQIYLMNFNRFLNDQTTLLGTNLIMQDVYFLEDSPEFSIRYRYTQRKSFAQYTLLNESTYLREHAVRLRFQFIEEFNNQTEYIKTKDILFATEQNNRERNVRSEYIVSDWSYRPIQNIELGFKLGVGQSSNNNSTIADINEQSIRFVYSFVEHGHGSAEIAREEVSVNPPSVVVPYQLTNGKVVGRAWLIDLRFEYRLSRFMHVGVNYNGRSENASKTIHSGNAEVRAFF